MIGTTLGHYRIVELIGAGGMGEVYRARDTRLARDVALKLLPAGLAADRERVERLTREARSVASLNHPNIVTIHSIEEAAGRPFLTMELVSGRTLDRLIGPGGLPVERLLAIATPLAAALAAAHAVGVVHRDLKPANVMVTDDGRPKVLDFGLARQIAPAEGVATALETMPILTREGGVMGTLPYMSPEQVQGRPLDGRSDIFSFGAMLHEMATGERPHRGGSDAEIITAILRDPPPPVTSRRAGLPAELDRVIGRCLEKDPARRFQTSLEVFRELEALRRTSHGSPAGGTGSGTAPTPPARARRRLLIGLSGLAVVVAAVAGGWQVRSGCAPSSAGASVAVLPFVNASQDPETDYLSDGVTAGVINRLSEFSGVKVMSRLSVTRFKDGSDPREAGRLLGVGSILTGRLDLRDGRLVVDVELTDVRDGRHLWGDRFERDRADVPAIEREIVGRISERLRLRLGGAAAGREARDRALDPAAYDLYLRGRYIMLGTSEDGPVRAQEFFRRAIEREPRLAVAYGGLGESYVLQAWLGSKERDTMVPLAKAALAKAVELDPDLAETQVLAGEVALYFDWDWAAAGAAYRRATELKPGSDLAHREYANYLSLMDRVEEGIAEARTAQALDPLSVYATHQLGYNLMAAGRLPEAAAEFRKAIDLNPSWIWGNIKLGLTWALLGECEDALASVRRVDELLAGGHGSPLAQSWLAWTTHRCGDPARARETLARLGADAKTRYVDPVAVAELYYGMGDHDRMLEQLERGFEVRSPLMVYLLQCRRFLFKPVADEPRFVRLLERMRFPEPPA